ncbi:MAG: RNA methyltransferase [Myxococcota bacterium]
MSQALFVSSTPGLEPALAEELSELGFKGREVAGGVELTAPDGAYREINLWSRIASRVLLRVAAVSEPGELSRVSLDPYGRTFALELGEGTGRFKAALARWGVSPPAGRSTDVSALPGGPGRSGPASTEASSSVPTLHARMDSGRCVLSVDTSGELLYLRGYRQEVGRAPLRETLAAGILRLAGWRPGEPLWDVMCGSGTILIEAAEQCAGLAPGRARHFAFEGFPSHDEGAWLALARERPATDTPLFGSDLNAGALGTARRNAKRAGVLERLTLERLDATKLPQRPGPGLVIANLPYGKRVGEKSELAVLYRGLGQSIRRLGPSWRFAFLLEEGALHLGLPFQRSFAVKNGGLRCELVTGRLEA